MKHTINTLTAIVVAGSTIVTSTVYADATTPKMEAENINMTAPAPKDDTAYWMEKKLEQQRKSTEIRKQKLEEMRSKGVDVSGISEDVLDASKTDEKVFWDTMKKAMQVKDAANRKKVVEELQKAGLDTNSLNSDALDPAITDEGKFWSMVKAIKETKMQKKYESMDYQKNIDSSSPLPKKEEPRQEMRYEIKQENKTDMNPVNKVEMKPEYKKEVKPEMKPEYKKEVKLEMKPEYKKEVKLEMQKPGQKPVLTEKMQQSLVKRFSAIPDEKKIAYYERTKANLEKQLEKALAKKNSRLARKITETLVILENVLGNNMDDAAEDEIINSATAE